MRRSERKRSSSLEVNPTQEQQGKAAIGAFVMIVAGAVSGGIGMLIKPDGKKTNKK